MVTRRTYSPNPTPEQEDPGTPPPPEAPAPSGSSWLATILKIAGGAVVGAVAVDMYRKHFSKTRNEPVDDEGVSPMGALPGAPSVMPMPMPMPFPMPMPMPGWGHGGGALTPNYRDERDLTDHEKLEMQRLKTEQAKADALAAQMRAWEDGDID